MQLSLTRPDDRRQLQEFYRCFLTDNVVPFWLTHGIDQQHGGIFTALDRDGTLLDNDKSVWFQGRAGWMFSTLYLTVDARPEWLAAALSCADFSRQHCHSSSGKMWFMVTRQGEPIRMRRYVFSEAFAAISYASVAVAMKDAESSQADFQQAALNAFETYLRYSFEPGVMDAKYESTRPTKGLAPLMIAIVTAQQLRELLGEQAIRGQTLSKWIENCIAEIQQDFFKPDRAALMEVVGSHGEIIDHFDGRTLNPGHAIECAWFIMHEGRLRNDPSMIALGTSILDVMWERGWDKQFGGLLYFADLYGKPVQEYWHDMKFWWPHCEAIIATLLAWRLTGDPKYADMHALVHRWSFDHFSDPQFGEWFGYLRRDGTVTQSAKGNMYKGPFHLPRMLWYCSRELEN